MAVVAGPGGGSEAESALREERERIRQAWEAFFDTHAGGYDVLICPSFSTPAFVKDERFEGDERANAAKRIDTVIDGVAQPFLFLARLVNSGAGGIEPFREGQASGGGDLGRPKQI